MLANAAVRIIRWVQTTENVFTVRRSAQGEHEVGSFGYGFTAIVPDVESRPLAGRRTSQKWRGRVAHECVFDQFCQFLPIRTPRRLPRLVDQRRPDIPLGKEVGDRN